MMMETTQTKFWPDAKVEGEYIGSFCSANGGRCDLYLDGDTVKFEWGKIDAVCVRISELEQNASQGLPNSSMALTLIRAHRAKQAKPEPPAPAAQTMCDCKTCKGDGVTGPDGEACECVRAGCKKYHRWNPVTNGVRDPITTAPPAPAAMSREDMIEKAARAVHESDNNFNNRCWDGMDSEYRRRRLRRAEAMLDAIGVLPPPLAPLPAPEKSANQKVAEGMFRADDWKIVISRGIQSIPFSVTVHPQGKSTAGDRAEQIAVFARAAIKEALDARDKAHQKAMLELAEAQHASYQSALKQQEIKHTETLRKELEALREACAQTAITKLDAIGAPNGFTYAVVTAIRATPLTIAERENAKPA